MTPEQTERAKVVGIDAAIGPDWTVVWYRDEQGNITVVKEEQGHHLTSKGDSV